MLGFFSFFNILFIDSKIKKGLSVAKTEQEEFYNILFRCVLILTMLLKVNSYLRVFKRLGLLVNLLSTCIVDIIPFTLYMFLWITTFIILSLILGVRAPER